MTPMERRQVRLAIETHYAGQSLRLCLIQEFDRMCKTEDSAKASAEVLQSVARKLDDTWRELERYT